MVDEELGGLLAAGERAVFRGVPGQGLVPLERAESLAEDLGEGPPRCLHQSIFQPAGGKGAQVQLDTIKPDHQVR